MNSRTHFGESQAFRPSLLAPTIEVNSRDHVLAVLRMRTVAVKHCLHCSMALLASEAQYSCCGHGTKMHFPWLQPPADLIEVFDTPGFSAISRIVNNLFTFAVLYSKDQGISYHVGAAAPAMRVQGQLYAKLMRTASNFWFIADAQYGQGYTALNIRQRDLVHRVHRIILRENKLLRIPGDISNMPLSTDVENGDIIVTASDDFLSAVYIGQGGVTPERCITVSDVLPDRGVVLGSRQSLTEHSPYWEPLLYVIFNVRGSTLETFKKGVTFPILRRANGKPMTMLSYLRSVILYEQHFWKSSRLAQQFIIDMWCRNEQSMVQYWMKPAFQARIREFLVYAHGREIPAAKIYMPSSYPGTFRYSQRNYHDALHISSQLGNPHLFITMTANPHWPEVQALLPPRQTACDRPDIIARVFQQKVLQLLARLNQRGYLGPSHLGALWIVYTIEWQQGGLPHVHLAVRLQIDELISPMDTIHEQLRFMQTVISAKIPPPDTLAKNESIHEMTTYDRRP